jgi:hypothetical protein
MRVDGVLVEALVLSAKPYGVRVESVDFGGDSRVGIDRFGDLSASGTVVLVAGRAKRTIQIGDGADTVVK